MLNFAEQTGSGAVIVVWLFLLQFESFLFTILYTIIIFHKVAYFILSYLTINIRCLCFLTIVLHIKLCCKLLIVYDSIYLFNLTLQCCGILHLDPRINVNARVLLVVCLYCQIFDLVSYM